MSTEISNPISASSAGVTFVESRVRVGHRLRQLEHDASGCGRFDLSRPRQPRSSPRVKIETNAPRRRIVGVGLDGWRRGPAHARLERTAREIQEPTLLVDGDQFRIVGH